MQYVHSFTYLPIIYFDKIRPLYNPELCITLFHSINGSCSKITTVAVIWDERVGDDGTNPGKVISYRTCNPISLAIRPADLVQIWFEFIYLVAKQNGRFRSIVICVSICGTSSFHIDAIAFVLRSFVRNPNELVHFCVPISYEWKMRMV